MNLEQLSANLGLDKEEYLELLEIMLESGFQDMERLKQATDRGDPEGAAKAAHSLKGAAANLGLMDLSEVAKEMEHKAREGALEEVSRTMELLEKKLQEVANLIA